MDAFQKEVLERLTRMETRQVERHKVYKQLEADVTDLKAYKSKSTGALTVALLMGAGSILKDLGKGLLGG